MAEAASLSSNVLCRYYMHGACREGANCRFSHNNETKPSLVCQYYLKGQCSYGDTCRYDHTKPQKRRSQSKLSSSAAGSGRMTTTADSSQTRAARLCSPAGKLAGNGPLRHTKSGSSPSAKTRSSAKPVNLPSQKTAGNDDSGRMVTLRKNADGSVSCDNGPGGKVNVTPTPDPKQWVQAAEFVPGRLWQGSGPSSYSQAAHTGVVEMAPPDTLQEGATTEVVKSDEMCPYAAHGVCRYGEQCAYMHGDLCDMCGREILHPTDSEQRKQHHEACVREHEEDMKLSFAVARSADKTCGICMEIVLEKLPPVERRFGILSNCCHVYCLSCIRKWRAAKQFQNKIIRACPECRVKSDFVTPNKYWVDEKEEKQQLIDSYKKVLSTKPCKYFDEGRGECPFNANCFYRHAYPDGRPASPVPIHRRRRQNGDGELGFIHQILLWDFLEERGQHLTYDDDDFDELLYMIGAWNSDDSESDLSDIDLYI